MKRFYNGLAFVLAALCLTMVVPAAFAQEAAAPAAEVAPLNIGDKAPMIQVKEFVKGQPVGAFEAGKVYVVEFWATWCGPCITSIPHVSDLAKKYPKVGFVGVSVWEQDQEKVKPFVTKMGEKMAYNVAMDDVPAGGDGQQGAMAKNWMKAAGQNGIPAAFIVNGEGKVAWIGHPMGMDKPLADVVAGKYDIAKATAEAKVVADNNRKMMVFRQKMQAAGRDPEKALAVVEAEIAADPKMEETLGSVKFAILRASGKNDDAAKYGRKLLDTTPLGKDAMALNEMAWGIVDPAAAMKPTKDLCLLARDAAKKADNLTQGKNSAIADTLAKALFDCGDIKGAVAAQERAVNLAKGTELEKDPDLGKRLQQYRDALKSSKGDVS